MNYNIDPSTDMVNKSLSVCNRHLRKMDCLMAPTTCLVYTVRTFSVHCKKTLVKQVLVASTEQRMQPAKADRLTRQSGRQCSQACLLCSVPTILLFEVDTLYNKQKDTLTILIMTGLTYNDFAHNDFTYNDFTYIYNN